MSRKTAICVGQNKYHPDSGVSPLMGCINDAMLIGEMLRTAGFVVRQLHDSAATQQQILGVLETEVAKLRDGDYLVFWNSSHGYQVQDRSPGSEEVDYRDEAICCYDNDIRDPLTDDKFQAILTRVNPNATVFIGSDSCHSATVTRELKRLLTGIPLDMADAPRNTEALQAPSARDLALEIIARDATIRTIESPIGKAIPPEVAELRREVARGLEIRNATPSQSQISASESRPAIEVRGYSQVTTDDAGLVQNKSINDPVGEDRQPRLFVPDRMELLFELGENPLNLDAYITDTGNSESGNISSNLDGYLGQPQVEVEADPEASVRRFGRLARRTPENAMSHLLLSGCLATEVSWDAPFLQERHGAMTYYFAVVVLEAWKRGEAITYKLAHQEASARLRIRFNQTPQLEGPDWLKDEIVFGYLPHKGSNRDYIESKVSGTTSTRGERTEDKKENIRQALDSIKKAINGI